MFDARRILTNTDDALLRGIRGLVDSDDVAEVIARLHEGTHRGDALPDGTPRLYYDTAVSCLEERREWELQARELLEAVAILLPSGDQETKWTEPVWPSIVLMRKNLPTSQLIESS